MKKKGAKKPEVKKKVVAKKLQRFVRLDNVERRLTEGWVVVSQEEGYKTHAKDLVLMEKK